MIAVMDRDDECNIHKGQLVDKSCPQCEEEWTCNECLEVRMYDPFVLHGRKCMVCTYENRGGE